MAVNLPEDKYAVGFNILDQKINVIMSTICVEGFGIISQSTQNSHYATLLHMHDLHKMNALSFCYNYQFSSHYPTRDPQRKPLKACGAKRQKLDSKPLMNAKSYT